MITFDELRITADGDSLVVNASIAPYDYYDNVYISAIYVDTDKTFSATGTPSSEAVLLYENTDSDTTIKNVTLSAEPKQFDLSTFNGRILYVYGVASGVPSSDTPCTMDNEYSIGIAVNWYTFYQNGMKYLRSTLDGCGCSPDDAFIDWILRFKAFELALRTGNYAVANTKIEEWYNEGRASKAKAPCRCG